MADILYDFTKIKEKKIKLNIKNRTTPIGAGTPINANGEIANDGTAIGLLKSPAYYPYRYKERIITAGVIDEEVRLKESDIELTAECKEALSNIKLINTENLGGSFTDTHYDTRKVEEFIYEFDGNTEGKEVVEVNGNPFVKVSDEIFPIGLEEERYKERVIYLYSTDTHEQIDELFLNEYAFYEWVEGKLIGIEGNFLAGFIALEDVEYNDIHFKKGIYLAGDSWGAYVGNFNVIIESGELKELDFKYVPSDLKEPYRANLMKPIGKPHIFSMGSFEEMLEAYNAGRRVQIKVPDSTGFLELSEARSANDSNSYFKFVHFDIEDSEVEVFTLKADGTIDYHWFEVTLVT